MKPIKITEDNFDKIVTAMREAEGRATARTITARDIIEAVENIEERFDIPKKYMVGLEFAVDPNAQHFPSAYKYTPESTQFTVKRAPSGWFLTSVYRYITNAPSKRYLLGTRLTDEQKNAILDRVAAWG